MGFTFRETDALFRMVRIPIHGIDFIKNPCVELLAFIEMLYADGHREDFVPVSFGGFHGDAITGSHDKNHGMSFTLIGGCTT